MKPQNKINIFIVDDNKVFTLALKTDIATLLGDLPIKIHSFETGEDCMKKFREEKPVVVILDYHLNSKFPNAADGIKILKLIKEQNDDTQVIMLTSNDHIDIAEKSFEAGAFDYIVKTETQFKRINSSLINVFNMMEAKQEARTYKRLFITFIIIAILALTVATIV